MKKAIILCSGGIDSVVTSHYVKKVLKYPKLKTIFFNYGQRSLKSEREYSKLSAEELKGEFIELNVEELGRLSNSLINRNKKANRLNKKDLKDTRRESENYYVPARNIVFLSYAIAIAESDYLKTKINSDIFVGFKNEGNESYPDSTQTFVNQINKINSATKVKFNIIAPMIKKDKEDIISIGKKLNVNFEKTFSCYVCSEKHCGTCLACKLRQQGFHWANEKDPTEYLGN